MERMETGLLLFPVPSVAPMGELGHNGFGSTGHAAGKGADEFHAALQAVQSETCCAALPSQGETEQAADHLGGTGAEPTLAVTIALAAISLGDSGERRTQEGTMPTAVSFAGDERQTDEAIFFATAVVGQAPVAQVPTEGTSNQPTNDTSGDSLTTSLAGLQPATEGVAAFSAPTGHVVRSPMASSDGDRPSVDAASARPAAPSQNQKTGNAQLTALRPVLSPSSERSSDELGQPGAEQPTRSSDRPGFAPVPVGDDPQTSPAQRREPVVTQANAQEGQGPPAVELRLGDEQVAATTATDRSTRQGREQTTENPTANEQEARELIGKPAGQGAVQSREPGQSVSMENGMPHMPSAPVAGTEIKQSDAALQAAPTQPDVSVRYVENLGGTDGAKTVQAVQVDLDPEDLGQVRVRVVLADSTVHTHVLTEHADVGQFLLNRRDQLESALQASGLDMGQFKVSVDRQASGQASYDWIARTFGDPPRQQRGQREQAQQDHIMRRGAEPRVLSVFA
ncbi:MAG: flagellar hook-length control protein FliK [Nitrospirota bacterium]